MSIPRILRLVAAVLFALAGVIALGVVKADAGAVSALFAFAFGAWALSGAVTGTVA